MALRLGDTAPNFKAETSKGPIDFHEFIGDSWTILFSHPDDYTPVCTTELSAVALSYADFASRGVKLIGLSANNVDSHAGWIKDIDNLNPEGPNVDFPIIADESREVSTLYGMLDNLDKTNVDKKGIPFTVRTVFIIDPSKTIRLTLAYPASTAPANWKKGDDVIVHPSVQGEKVKELFGDDVKTVYPYLRFTSDPSSKA